MLLDGHDVIAQAAIEASNLVLQYLMYDGHGSTRAVLEAAAVVAQNGSSVDQLFAYHAYGNLVAGTKWARESTSTWRGLASHRSKGD